MRAGDIAGQFFGKCSVRSPLVLAAGFVFLRARYWFHGEAGAHDVAHLAQASFRGDLGGRRRGNRLIRDISGRHRGKLASTGIWNDLAAAVGSGCDD